jgi:hypothetical protein
MDFARLIRWRLLAEQASFSEELSMSSQVPNPSDPRRYRYDDSAWGCGWAWLWFWLFIIVICFGGWGWAGWWGGWGGPWGWWGPRPYVNVPENTRTVTAPDPFVGKTVTVIGQVDQVFSPQVFTLGGGERRLLVIEKGKSPAVKKGEKVQVKGTVEKFDSGHLGKETGVDMSKIPASEFTGEPAVVASTVSAQASPD